MTLEGAFHNPKVRSAARRVFRKYHNVPGCLNDPEDFLQEAMLGMAKAGSVPEDDGLLFAVASRRMIDAARSQMAITRTQGASGTAWPEVIPIDECPLFVRGLTPFDHAAISCRHWGNASGYTDAQYLALKRTYLQAVADGELPPQVQDLAGFIANARTRVRWKAR